MKTVSPKAPSSACFRMNEREEKESLDVCECVSVYVCARFTLEGWRMYLNWKDYFNNGIMEILNI